MAAIGYPYLVPRAARSGTRTARRPHPHLRLVEAPPKQPRRRLPLVAVIGLILAAWFGVGALASPGRPGPAAGGASTAAAVGTGNAVGTGSPVGTGGPVGTESAVAPGIRYVVRPGDTLWGIVLRLDPGADPRPLVDELEAELDGRALEPGMTLALP